MKKLTIYFKEDYTFDVIDGNQKLENMRLKDLRKYYGNQIAEEMFNQNVPVGKRNYELTILSDTDLDELKEKKKLEIHNNKFIFLNSTLEERL